MQDLLQYQPVPERIALRELLPHLSVLLRVCGQPVRHLRRGLLPRERRMLPSLPQQRIPRSDKLQVPAVRQVVRGLLLDRLHELLQRLLPEHSHYAVRDLVPRRVLPRLNYKRMHPMPRKLRKLHRQRLRSMFALRDWTNPNVFVL